MRNSQQITSPQPVAFSSGTTPSKDKQSLIQSYAPLPTSADNYAIDLQFEQVSGR